MRMLVLGAGLQGTACAFDLLQTTEASTTLADSNPENLHPCVHPHVGKRLEMLELDVRDEATVLEVMRRHDAVMSAVPYYYNFELARLAVAAGVHFCDLGGNTEIVRQQRTLDAEARRSGISVVPDCGLAPGLVNVVAAEGIRRVAVAESVKLYVGGLPRYPEPPLNYQVVYSLEGALDYYTTPSWILRNGKLMQVHALSEPEDVPFPEPLGTLEAFHTGGGISTMPWEFEGRVQTMEYKTLRYPGHAAIMEAIREVGLLGLDPVDMGGATVRPRDAFIAVVEPKLRKPGAEDLVALKVVVEGSRDAESVTTTFELLDYPDPVHEVSAMMRVSGYSLSITGQMQVDGRMSAGGVATAYQATPFEVYITELRKRGVEVVER